MFQSAFMIEQEMQLRRSKAQLRQAELRRLVVEAGIEAGTRQTLRWPDLSVLSRSLVCWRQRWLPASAPSRPC